MSRNTELQSKLLVIIIIHKTSLIFSTNIFAVKTVGSSRKFFNASTSMNQNHFEHNSNSPGFNKYQSPQYSIDYQEDLNQQRWEESKNELLNMMRSFCEMVIQQARVHNIRTFRGLFSKPSFDSNDDFTSSDDESLSDEDVPEDNFKIYSNPLFEFDDEYISSDVNPLFDEVLEDIECKDSYDSNLDESTFLVTPLSDSNEDECLAPSDDIELLLHHDPSISVVSILEGFTDEPPLEENDDLFDLESKENDWKKILYDAPIDDLITEDKVFDPGIHEIIFSPTYVNLSFVDRHYLSFTYVIRTFLPYFTYPVNSPFPLSSGSEDIIFDPGISAFHFSSLKPVAYECPMEDCPDYEDSRARGFVPRSLDLQSLACLFMGIRYPRSY
ncbi:hypothetical protein Tco_1514475 [Tanacetum coccineum]